MMVVRFDKFAFISAILLLFVLGVGVGIATGSIRLATAAENTALPIIVYHRMAEEESADVNCISVMRFESDLKWLEEHGYQSVSANDVAAFSRGDSGLPKKPVMLAFADGYLSIYSYAYPLLKQYEFKGVLFPVISYVEYASQERNRSVDYSYLTRNEMLEMVNSGVMEVQNHSYRLHSSSPNANGILRAEGESVEEYRERVGDDLAKSQRLIQSYTRCEPCAFLCPKLHYDGETISVFKNVGFCLIITSQPRMNIIKKADSAWCYGLGSFIRKGTVDSETFFDSIGLN